MVSPLIARAPQCSSCLRRMVGAFGDTTQFPAGQQIRGKKRLAKPVTVNVQLLQNVPGYGRRGAVIPVTPGVMRNIWYPKKMAEYLTAEKLQALGAKKDAVVERDATFRSNMERRIEKQMAKEQEALAAAAAAEAQANEAYAPSEPEKEVAPHVDIDLLTPQQATTILEGLLPPNLDFYRTPITPTAPKRVSPSIPASASISIGDREKAAKGQNGKTSIYGSVSTSDIAVNLKAILAEDEKGSRVVLSPDKIIFVDEMDEHDRVKHLGIYEIEIQLEGATEAVRRTIQVHAQD